jgi:hypothetical protein
MKPNGVNLMGSSFQHCLVRRNYVTVMFTVLDVTINEEIANRLFLMHCWIYNLCIKYK